MHPKHPAKPLTGWLHRSEISNDVLHVLVSQGVAELQAVTVGGQKKLKFWVRGYIFHDFM